MNLRLVRHVYSDMGIFGELYDEANNKIAVTLEHAYNKTPKTPPGTYTCVRGAHRLHNMVDPFDTFEIEGVVGHDNILFHWGNFNKDSDGCVLLGEARVGDMITLSKLTFAKFMKLQEGLNRFELRIIA